ncbi:phosphate acetyltransferase [Allofustis seminis]|uniref:phosphate acetyltransferase n=1 Tax=Allofustis seminis TaxID=166939 RepID=UPI0003722889|nr:phosphate acetyltransferase [Allofustis seminis]
MNIFSTLKEQIRDQKITLVFPEGEDVRILEASARLKKEQLVDAILLGDADTIKNAADAHDISLDGIRIIDPYHYEAFEEMVAQMVEIRRGKVTEDQARELLRQTNYFGTMLVKQDIADGLVGGVIYSTGDTVRPGLQIIKTKPNTPLMSGAFLMMRGDEAYIFGDCAINIKPYAEQLAAIAIETAKTAETFGIAPQVAMLSFSTKGSGKGEDVDKVRKATAIAKQQSPTLALDGELQFDAAFVPDIAEKKAPESNVAGKANVFIFPDLEAGNIGYKIAQRLGQFEAVGPILQGMAKPISDLSRGADAEDVYKTAIITASQVISNRKAL